MSKNALRLARLIVDTVRSEVAGADTVTAYRKPLVRFADAGDSRFSELPRLLDPDHMLPQSLLVGAQSVVSYFIPFEVGVVKANGRDQRAVAVEWALAYVETNELIGRISDHLIEMLAAQGVRAAAEPATGNFSSDSLTSRWSHKSVAAIAGLGSFGLHHMIITDAGCAGRLGSLVLDAPLPVAPVHHRERCLWFYDGSCRACVERCPTDALSEDGAIDKERCWERCLEVAEAYKHLGTVEVCGKCVVGPCSFESPL